MQSTMNRSSLNCRRGWTLAGQTCLYLRIIRSRELKLNSVDNSISILAFHLILVSVAQAVTIRTPATPLPHSLALASRSRREDATRRWLIIASSAANNSGMVVRKRWRIKLSDEQYHNLGVGMDAEEPDLGRFEVTKEEKMRGAFKTPTLRNVALTAPYMHDGSQATLEEVMAWYNKGGHKNPWLSDKVKVLNLTEQELADVVEFMKQGLTGDFPEVETGRLPE